jgi:hypothetical protein
MREDGRVIVEEVQVSDGHIYNGKIIGWRVRGRYEGREFTAEAPTLSQAREALAMKGQALPEEAQR